MSRKKKRIFIILAIVATLLLIPFITMPFTNDVNWTLGDFVVAGVLLLGTGLMCELVIRKFKIRKHRIVICIVLLLLLFLIWVELAVGIL